MLNQDKTGSDLENGYTSSNLDKSTMGLIVDHRQASTYFDKEKKRVHARRNPK